MKRHFFAYFGRSVSKKEQLMSVHTKPVAIMKNKGIMRTEIYRKKLESKEREKC